MPIADISRVFLATYFVAVGLFYAAKMAGVRARTGQLSQTYGRVRSPQFWGRAVFEVFRAAIVVACVLRVIDPRWDAWSGPISLGAAAPWLQTAGMALLLAALALIIYAHSFLGAEWRTGVPREGPTALICHGVYARLRHPIFLGVYIGQAGLALAWPSLFTVVCLIVGFAVIQVQTRVEEASMEKAFGPAYLAYKRRTPAFIPRLGALPPQSAAARIWD